MRVLGVCTGYWALKLRDAGHKVVIGCLNLPNKDVIVFDVIGNLINAGIPVLDAKEIKPGLFECPEEMPKVDFKRGVTKLRKYHQSRTPREVVNLTKLDKADGRRVSHLKTPNWKVTT